MSESPDPANGAPTAEPTRSAKQRLRAELLERRGTLPRAGYDPRLLAALEPVMRVARRVAAYAPLPREPGGAGLPALLAARVDALLLPVLRPDNDLDWAAYEGPLPEPAAGRALREPAGPRLGPDAIAGVDLVLVPAVAVGRASGIRLGRGGGSYDRALARVPAGTPVLALLYPGELLDEVPYEPHDQRVTGVVTVDGLVAVPG